MSPSLFLMVSKVPALRLLRFRPCFCWQNLGGLTDSSWCSFLHCRSFICLACLSVHPYIPGAHLLVWGAGGLVIPPLTSVVGLGVRTAHSNYLGFAYHLSLALPRAQSGRSRQVLRDQRELSTHLQPHGKPHKCPKPAGGSNTFLPSSRVWIRAWRLGPLLSY